MRRLMISVGAMLYLIAYPVFAQEAAPNLTLYVDRNFLAIYVSGAESTSLVGLAFGVATAEGTFESFSLVERFPILRLVNGIAQPGSCYVYSIQGTDPLFPNDCTASPAQFFRQDVPRADAFWYDFTRNSQRDVAVFSGDQPLTICSSAVPACEFNYVPGGTDAIEGGESAATTETASDVVTANADWTPVIETKEGMELALVPKGCFNMGSSEEQYNFALDLCEAAAGVATCANINFSAETPQSAICFEQPFWIGRYEVTNSQYGSYGLFAGAEKPRERVSWEEANEFCNSLGLRLPTEAEWEYAARGPDSWIYPWGDEFIARHVVYKLNSAVQTANVSRNESGASWVGAFHMSGNLWEWTSTFYQDYPYDPADGRESQGRLKVIRGGSWGDGDSIVRSAYRGRAAPDYRDDYTGFRCAGDLQPGDPST
ncbi:MAG TPA: formylglycine-generating enzyme family protein [Aggregatilineales bacterium]|nr:formylglycine-generating enzyme family protein [Aggregatilineales bacterium]